VAILDKGTQPSPPRINSPRAGAARLQRLLTFAAFQREAAGQPRVHRLNRTLEFADLQHGEIAADDGHASGSICFQAPSCTKVARVNPYAFFAVMLS
jgi:hypothetical protein